MKKKIALGIIFVVCIAAVGVRWFPVAAPSVDAARDYSSVLRVFPQAEGFGVDTPAGRGGAVLHVTTLDPEGPGSLRAALEQAGPHTIVFDVGGIVHLTTSLHINEPFVTVAGQTAPSPGITVTGATLEIHAHDVLIQHLRFRVGDDVEGPAPDARDGISVYDGPNGPTSRVVVDHCSVSWAIDEGMSTWGSNVSDVTFSNCIVAENLSHSLHPEVEHSRGILIGDHTKRFSVLNSLLADNLQRNPFVKGDVTALVANNIIYNCEHAVHTDDPEGSGPSCARLADNLFVPGPSTPWYIPFYLILADAKPGTTVAMEGNATSGHLRYFSLFPWLRIKTMMGRKASQCVDVKPLTLLPAEQLPEKILPHIGARPADRDAVDERIVREFMERKGRVIDSPRDVGGLPSVDPVRRPAQVPADPGKDSDGDGYTDIEETLQEMAARIEGRG